LIARFSLPNLPNRSRTFIAAVREFNSRCSAKGQLFRLSLGRDRRCDPRAGKSAANRETGIPAAVGQGMPFAECLQPR
jgi:hypothetical protein